MSDAKVLIGAAIYGNVNTFSTGIIDEVRIWNQSRTAQQIQSTMNDTLGPPYYSTADSGLVAYWRFEIAEDLGILGGGVDDIRDFSIYQNHGDLEGNWRLYDTVTAVKEGDSMPSIFSLSQNYPNPFNPESKISFQIPIASDVTLKIYDLLGREVATLVNERMSPGTYSATWNAAAFASGVYLYRMQAVSASTGSARGFVETRKLLLLR
ncbi:MAG: T9SS type A sorting domain-containing protein [Bacteroidetes bacterium]|nr:T9SS type A sorting domain-containing protein [Bacteroidota bacterium]MCW5896827.1 T9SS type A sorting domain-containing protein [Bacteroidota bacterium]